jgi:hypothetical protein
MLLVRPHHDPPVGRAPSSAKETSAQAGWVFLVGIMMVLLGISGALQGFVAIFDPDYYLVGS